MEEETIRDQFYCSRLGLRHPQPQLFVKSQWPLPHWIYVIWRGVWCIWHLVWIIISGLDTRNDQTEEAGDGAKWFVYIGNIVFVLTTATCTLDLLIVVYHTVKQQHSVNDDLQIANETAQADIETAEADKDEIIFQGEFILEDDTDYSSMSTSLSVLWCMYDVINCANVLVTIMHWSVEQKGHTDVVEVVVHAVNSLFVVVNLLVTAMPVQVLHFIYPTVFVVIYFLFNLIYFLCDGTNLQGNDVIFRAIDWHETFPTILTLLLGIFLAIPLVHLLMFALYTFRLYLFSFIKTGNEDNISGKRKKKSSPNPCIYLTSVSHNTT